ncbi:MAG: HEPN domain-containing protein [Bacteroidetes bacterium]|nr:HEPN domain-containing protein [Bacteroidota bacterium]MBU2583756.1 HEPN domain-containing protein [Bacteroidota bacterium]
MGVDISNLIKYRLERCKETIEEVELAIKNKKLHLAENRIYYSIFYLVSALALKYNFSTSKHSQLKGWFNKNFILTGKISKEYGEIYYTAFENRQEGDYEDLISFELEDVQDDFDKMLRFVEEIEKLLQD